MNYVCKGCSVFGDFNQTYVQGYGTPNSVSDAAAMYVGAKGTGFGVFSAVAGVEDVTRYHYRSANGKCTSTSVSPSDGNAFPIVFCYENDIEDCIIG